MTIESPVMISIGPLALHGTISVPPAPRGLVVFAHGSGSGGRSPRNSHIAAAFYERGLATLMFDLLTTEEDRHDGTQPPLRFDIEILAERLVSVTDWVHHQPFARGLRIGYFGSGTGTAASLVAAARRSELIDAVVSRGGRPDLVAAELYRVRAPTLVIVGGKDRHVLDINRRAMERLLAPHHVAVIPNASHLFTEPGSLDRLAELAGDWFLVHLGAHHQAPRLAAHHC